MPIQSSHASLRGAPRARRLHSLLAGLPFAALAAVAHADDGAIEVVTVRGDVRVASATGEQPAKAGMTLDLPSTIRTGRDGTTDLRQGDTTIGIGPGTELEFPAPATPGAPVDRIVQPLGNAFYNVGPRGNRRLRVETPYLVAVIKGTQFNVAVEPDSGAISLHEGSLEVLAPDIAASVVLNAGEIAMRHRGDDAIRVIPMREAGTPVRTAKEPAASADADADDDVKVPAVIDGDGGTLAEDGGLVTPIGPADGEVAMDAEIDAAPLPDAQVDVDAGVDTGVDLGVDTDLAAGDVSADVGVDLGGADAVIDTALETLDTGIDVGLGDDTPLIDTTSQAEDTAGLLDGALRRIGT